ncbi:amidohydrolase family protein [Roseimaritima sediminicola]|uniref:amidohydrolase family protein n=1 Tax=Roseimaritima sediminicola TaxID=2662066 RepID=UPI0012985562|nr:amidohydrolase family protein [Roseimaritima sediminicola]
MSYPLDAFTSHQLTGSFAARWIVPVASPPIAGGWIRVKAGRIVQLETSSPPADCLDLGDVALMPGLVNAHTHLEFSDLTTPLGRPGNRLPDWISAVVRYRRGAWADPSAAAEARQRIVLDGCAQSHRSGVRLVADIATQPYLRQTPPTPLRLLAMVETLGLLPERAEETFALASEWLDASPQGLHLGISPHAPYSTSPQLIRRCIQAARRQRMPLAMHVAESREELELVQRGSGPFRDALESLGVWQEEMFPLADGIDGLLRRLSEAPRCLVVHGNYLTTEQIGFLAGNPHMSLVYCPRTHRYFDHQRYPLERCLEAGVRVALGTDSRSSNPDLILWNEIRHVASHFPEVSIETALTMGSLWGAQALGHEDVGHLHPGAEPGILVVPTAAPDAARLWTSLLECPLPVWLRDWIDAGR